MSQDLSSRGRQNEEITPSKSSKKVSHSSSLKRKQTQIRSTRKFIEQFKQIKEEVEKQAEIGSLNQYPFQSSQSDNSDANQSIDEGRMLQKKIEIYEDYLEEKGAVEKVEEIAAVHRLPEPTKKYLARERTTEER